MISGPRPSLSLRPPVRRGSLPRPLSALVVLLLALASPACDDDGKQFSEGSDGKMVVSPLAITFPQLPPGQQDQQLVSVRNEGTGPVVLPLQNYVIDPATEPFIVGYLEVDGEVTERLDPGEEGFITVSYLSEDDSEHFARLLLETSDGDTAEVLLSTVRPVPLLQVVPNPVTFSGTSPGATDEQTVVVTNVGSVRLEIASVRYVPENTTDFTIVSGIPAEPVTLQVDESFEIVVQYTPTGDLEVTDVGFLRFESNTGGTVGRTDVEVRGSLSGPRIEIEPGAIDFGALEKGDVESRPLIIHNLGEGPLDVSSIYLAFESSSDFAYDDVASVVLQEGEQTQVSVSYSPTDGGVDSGYLVFESNDPLNSGVLIPLNGAWAGPDMEVRPTRLAFGQVAIGASKTLSFDIFNNGLRDLTVSEIAQVINPAGTDLSVSIQGNVFPAVIPGLGKKRVTVVYAPTTELAASVTELEVRSDDPEQPTETVTVTYTGVANGACEFKIVPTSLNFGLVPGGYNKALPIVVRNDGAGACYLNNVAIAADFLSSMYGNPFALATPFQAFQLDPGETAMVDINYAPFSGETDAFAAKALFYVSDVLSGQMNLTCPSASGSMFPSPGQCSSAGLGTNPCWACVQGKTGDPALAAVPGNVDFGLVTIGCNSQDVRVRIYNKGTAPTTLSSVQLDSTCAGPFTLQGVPPLPAALNPGTFQEVEVRYRPTLAGQEDSCSLMVTATVDPTSGSTETLTIPLRGEGTNDEFQTDVFDQVSGRKVDVLFVVDNSGSMGDDQSNLANNFSSFIAAANTWGVDFQLGVTTTDDSHEGKLQNKSGRPRIIANSRMTTAEVEAAFKDNVKVGDSGSGTERGLKAAELALSDPNATSGVPGNCPGSSSSNACSAPYTCDTQDQSCGGYNATFIRDDASLEVIFVSDEVDQSPAVVDFYVDFFKNIKGYQNDALLHAYAIVGYDDGSGCSTSSFQRYRDVATRTGGSTWALCGNFAATLAGIGNNAFGLRVQFFLSRVPVPSSIRVSLGGTPTSTGWRFDAPSNAIIFDTGSVPAENTTIEVSYQAACF